MKIGTITFHWGTNYGAVLQAFALQKYLKTNEYDTEIINYVPFKVKFKNIISNIKDANIKALLKEYQINKFRKGNLSISHKKYNTNSQLVKMCNDYDIYICGSDQVWNEWFAMHSENKPNLSYYLNFVKKNKIRISYAASFGTNKLSSNLSDLIKLELNSFSNISVREETGKGIVENMGFDTTVVVDPTLLLERHVYDKLIENKNVKKKYKFFSYILHINQKTAGKIGNYVFGKYFDKDLDNKYNDEPIDMYEWLYNIKHTNFVLTNSFHGAVFSILFHTPFMIIPVEDSTMNDRIITLLNSVGLQNRIINDFDENNIDKLMNESVDWEKVDNTVHQMRKKSIEFLEKALKV